MKQIILCVPGKHIRFVFPRALQTNRIIVTFICVAARRVGKRGPRNWLDPGLTLALALFAGTFG